MAFDNKAIGTEIKSVVARGWGLGVRIDHRGPRKLLRVMNSLLFLNDGFKNVCICQNLAICHFNYLQKKIGEETK